MNDKIKILLCGDVEGKFNTFFNRVENIIKKSGQFDLALCVGNFFGINNKEFDVYKRGIKKVPVTTYILGPNNEDSMEMFKEDSEICENVYYLGKRGLYVTSNGLKIAYISGVCNNDTKSKKNYQYSSDDVSALCDVCIKEPDNFRGVDILLTSQWPADIAIDKLKNPIINATDIISWLAVRLKPRYHVSGLEGMFFERQPYRITGNDSSIESVTRFIGLARVGNPQKEKWIYALNLMPIDKMKIGDILQKTTDETSCPYNVEKFLNAAISPKKRNHDSNQYFYDMNAPEEQKGHRKQKRQKIEFDQSKCWFCLASTKVEKHLIVTVGTEVYIALAKGGIVDEHFLICPVQHYQCSTSQPASVLDEIDRFKEAITKFYARNDTVPVFFERNYKTSHMQLQCIPIPNTAQRELEEIFQEEAESQGIKLNELDPSNRLDQVVENRKPYYFLELPNGKKFYANIDGPKGFPINFGRDVLALGPILNKPDSIEWKDCVMDKEDEEALVKRIRTDFEPYDITD